MNGRFEKIGYHVRPWRRDDDPRGSDRRHRTARPLHGGEGPHPQRATGLRHCHGSRDAAYADVTTIAGRPTTPLDDLDRHLPRC